VAAATILDCQIHKILLANGGWRAQTHHCTKFRQNQLFLYGNIVISNFQNGRRRHLGFEKFYWLLVWRWSVRISYPNFVKSGQSVAKILRFFNFSKWRLPPSWIVEFAKIYWLTVFGGHRRITVPNSSKLVVSLRRYCNF